MEIRLPFTSFLSFVIQCSAARQSGNFRQMVKETYRSYRRKISNQNFRKFFINVQQPQFFLSLKSLKLGSVRFRIQSKGATLTAINVAD